MSAIITSYLLPDLRCNRAPHALARKLIRARSQLGELRLREGPIPEMGRRAEEVVFRNGRAGGHVWWMDGCGDGCGIACYEMCIIMEWFMLGVWSIEVLLLDI